LIFHQNGRIVAKLADFGLSIDEAKSDLARAYLGGTPGWQAPEVEARSMLYSHGLLQTDNYSFGLLVWSTMLHSGKVPPLLGEEARQDIAKRELENARKVIGFDMYPTLGDAVQKLLKYDSHRRPLRVADLLADGLRAEETA
jgi:serine/threonine protein kinase